MTRQRGKPRALARICHGHERYYGALDLTTSTRLTTSTTFEFQTSGISRALLLYVGVR